MTAVLYAELTDLPAVDPAADREPPHPAVERLPRELGRRAVLQISVANQEKIMAVLRNHVSAVVGGTSGIGARTAELFAAEGASVVIAGRRRELGEELAARLGPRAGFVRADVTRESDVAAVIAHTVERHGRLDSLVNCAGVTGFVGGVADVDMAEFTAMMAVHAGGVLASMKHAAPVMSRQGSGSIVNVASIGGRLAGWTGHAYAASKAAVLQLTRSAAVELGEHGVRVNSISPGPVLTGVFGKAAGIDPAVADRTAGGLEAAFTTVLAHWQPIRGAAVPDDVARAALWLAGDGSRFVNGHDLVVDGGISAGRTASASAGDGAALGAALMAAAAPRGVDVR